MLHPEGNPRQSRAQRGYISKHIGELLAENRGRVWRRASIVLIEPSRHVLFSLIRRKY
jgi:hypothetical protein